MIVYSPSNNNYELCAVGEREAVICPNILIGMAVPSTSLFTALEYCKVGRSDPDRESEKESSSEERIFESLESR